MATPHFRRAEGTETFSPHMCSIPEGYFQMGCDAGRDDEKPAHRIWVDAFELAAFQTTNSQYARFLENTARAPPSLWSDPDFNNPEQPVVAVSWFEADAYCQWLSGLTDKKFRLPTEAEWERAARGGVEAEVFPWGDCSPENLPNYANRWKSGPEPVGLYAPNAYGLFNMGDNVHEWCADWYDASYYLVSPERNPQGPSSSSRRASRGGSWRHHIKVTRTAARSSIPPQLKYADYGFRVAASL
ncbi:MAG TPA: SUMF1/EgtB/PvdO family nonheme iron enzyme [Candidatus Acidoferrales bacterium]|nr:SUMF1/EgtB/PvdO family nonheme iron enzyme [Candidatus Acidoferrales bacterium]